MEKIRYNLYNICHYAHNSIELLFTTKNNKQAKQVSFMCLVLTMVINAIAQDNIVFMSLGYLISLLQVVLLIFLFKKTKNYYSKVSITGFVWLNLCVIINYLISMFVSIFIDSQYLRIRYGFISIIVEFFIAAVFFYIKMISYKNTNNLIVKKTKPASEKVVALCGSGFGLGIFIYAFLKIANRSTIKFIMGSSSIFLFIVGIFSMYVIIQIFIIRIFRFDYSNTNN